MEDDLKYNVSTINEALLMAKHFDSGKLPWALLPYDALAKVVEVFRAGTAKYDAHNWEKGMMYSRLMGSTMRHLFGDPPTHNGWWGRDDVDAETKCLHLAQACTDLLFLLTYELRGLGGIYDDRPGKNNKENTNG